MTVGSSPPEVVAAGGHSEEIRLQRTIGGSLLWGAAGQFQFSIGSVAPSVQLPGGFDALAQWSPAGEPDDLARSLPVCLPLPCPLATSVLRLTA